MNSKKIFLLACISFVVTGMLSSYSLRHTTETVAASTTIEEELGSNDNVIICRCSSNTAYGSECKVTNKGAICAKSLPGSNVACQDYNSSCKGENDKYEGEINNTNEIVYCRCSRNGIFGSECKVTNTGALCAQFKPGEIISCKRFNSNCSK